MFILIHPEAKNNEGIQLGRVLRIFVYFVTSTVEQ